MRFGGGCYDEDTLIPYSTEGRAEDEGEGEAQDDDDDDDDDDDESGDGDDGGDEDESGSEDGGSDGDYSGERGLEVWRKYGGYIAESHIWYVGSECARKAAKAHEARHWMVWLGDGVEAVVGGMGVGLDDGVDHGDGVDGEDRIHAILLAMEENGSLRGLQDGLLARFEMLDDSDDSDGDGG